jgi:hypothetical protein
MESVDFIKQWDGRILIQDMPAKTYEMWVSLSVAIALYDEWTSKEQVCFWHGEQMEVAA